MTEDSPKETANKLYEEDETESVTESIPIQNLSQTENYNFKAV